MEESPHPTPSTLGPEALRQLIQEVPEVAEYLASYVDAKIDRAKLSLKNLLLGIGLMIVGVALATALTGIGLWLLFSGLAEGLEKNFPNQPWAGETIVGGALTLLLTSLFLGIYAKLKRGSLKKQIKAYEIELREQKARFGHNAAERATAGQIGS